jgi:LCP family protein required for cell wall assembly
MLNKKKLLLIIGGLILFSSVGFTANYIYESVDYKTNLSVNTQSEQESDSAVDEDNDYKSDIAAKANIINILFLGIDKTDKRESTLGIFRSDTIALARINLDSKKIKVINIPRDTYTYVPIENKSDKINHAYAFGIINGNGVQASIEAVNHFLNSKVVDYYILMNMEPIPSIVDEIGGVKLDVEIAMKDHGANLEKGLQVLYGKQAYDYIHWRYSAQGDIDRIKRQQKFLSTLYKQQRDSGKIMDTLHIILNYSEDIKTDFTLKQMIGLAKFMSDIPDGFVTYYTIPGQGKMINGISYWVPDDNKTNEVLKAFFDEDTLES